MASRAGSGPVVQIATVSGVTRSSTRSPGVRPHQGTEYREASKATRASFFSTRRWRSTTKVGLGRQRPQGAPVGRRPGSDHLAVGAVDLGPAERQPGGEGGVHLPHGGEGPALEHMGAHDLHLALDPTLVWGRRGAARRMA